MRGVGRRGGGGPQRERETLMRVREDVGEGDGHGREGRCGGGRRPWA